MDNTAFKKNKYDILVVGGGHAGCEAALVASRMGFSVLVITMTINDIAGMPCNPAIGGLAKGQLVREIDALGGEMGRVIDETGIQFKMLNKSKGPAVWSPRAQADKKTYHERMLKALREQRGLDIVEAEATGIIVESGRVVSVEINGGEKISAERVILALGTFPNGLMHIGEKKIPGGRRGEPPARGLTNQLASMGFEKRRLKTGTPPRLKKETVDFSKCEPQPGDHNPSPFSFRTTGIDREQILCYVTHTNKFVHELITRNIDRAPIYSGQIEGTGPRYCPSIEDKVVRFSEKERHQLFLEPEGLESEEIYVNGLATSLPVDIQEEMIKHIRGLEDASIVKYGYAIEYDFFPPHQIYSSLESKRVKGLYFAGQVNGTSGYEEAAAQGIMAGINASLALRGESPLILRRNQAYIGVLIDDLVTKEIDEPYRMFTSRAEYRLLLRQDNADERLLKYAVRYGLLPKEQWKEGIKRRKRVIRAGIRLSGETITKDICNKALKEVGGKEVGEAKRAGDLLSRPEVELNMLEKYLPDGPLKLSGREKRSLEIRAKYSGYIKRQGKMAERFIKMDMMKIPQNFSYMDIGALSMEAREKMEKFKPETLGQASRLAGVRAADLSIIMVMLEKDRKEKRG
jgi:tRNA uridine 5-carboxymethylaminomethyl modification enzyme